MKVEIWSDYICAFCYLGRKQFEAALRQFSHRDKVEILLRSFELRPEIHPQLGISIYEYASQVSGIAPSRARQMYAQVSEQAEKIGIDYQPDKIVPANTFHAHCLTHYAADHGKSLELSKLIYQAYFSEGINIDDPDVLISLAERIGLNKTEAEEVLKNDRYAEKVWEDEKTSRLMGIQGVPFFLFDRNHGVSGAQDVSIFKKALETAWNSTIAAPKESYSDRSEPGCSDGSCSI
jgi:predicted DsbA family dithiol-disulfide isomerase